jgi:hypothetical protein
VVPVRGEREARELLGRLWKLETMRLDSLAL